MTNLIQDLNTLTNIPEKSLQKLAVLAINSISNTVWETCQTAADVSMIDLGIGILHIKAAAAGEIKYHFEPSDALRRALKGAISTNYEPLTPKLVASLKAKFMDVYKEIC